MTSVNKCNPVINFTTRASWHVFNEHRQSLISILKISISNVGQSAIVSPLGLFRNFEIKDAFFKTEFHYVTTVIHSLWLDCVSTWRLRLSHVIHNGLPSEMSDLQTRAITFFTVSLTFLLYPLILKYQKRLMILRKWWKTNCNGCCCRCNFDLLKIVQRIIWLERRKLINNILSSFFDATFKAEITHLQ